MNFPRLLLSAFAAFVVYFIYGFIVHGRLIAKDYLPYPLASTAAVKTRAATYCSALSA